MNNFPILSLLIFLPFIGILTLLPIQTHSNRSITICKIIALTFGILNFMLSIILLLNFDHKIPDFQFEEKLLWIKIFAIHYQLGIDGISLYFILLTTLLIPICILVSWHNITHRVKEYLIYFLLLEMFVVGVFCALDIVLFYIFFEAMLIPMFLLIGIWGGDNRIYAAYKFFLYTLAGSLFMLIAIIYIYSQISSMDVKILVREVPKFSLQIQQYLWLCFFVSFAIKVPMWPVHTWLPDAHVQAPTSGSIILAGIIIKMGAYGFLRFSLPLLPEASYFFKDLMIVLSIIAVIYGALVALAQEDIKKLVAYSSISHMGFVTAGIFSMNQQAITGAVIQMLSHGLISSGLFFSIGVIYERIHTREIAKYGGIAEKMRIFSIFLMILTMSSIGLPGTSGFIGEFLILVGIFKENIIFATCMTTGMVFGAIYMLSLYKRSMFGEVTIQTSNLSDLVTKEIIIYLIFTVLILMIGLYPKIITNYTEVSVNHLLKQIVSR